METELIKYVYLTPCGWCIDDDNISDWGDIVMVDYKYSDYEGEVTDIRHSTLTDPKPYDGQIKGVIEVVRKYCDRLEYKDNIFLTV